MSNRPLLGVPLPHPLLLPLIALADGEVGGILVHVVLSGDRTFCNKEFTPPGVAYNADDGTGDDVYCLRCFSLAGLLPVQALIDINQEEEEN